MPRFSKHFKLGLSQHQLDFVDISNEYDTPVYVDPFAIEIKNDVWSEQASHQIRIFFLEVLEALRSGDDMRAASLMSNLREPKETFLGVSSGDPHGRGVGHGQANKLIKAIKNSRAYSSGLLSDLSEMSLYVEGVDRDKISDLTTNIIRNLLVEYTQEQCDVFGIETLNYNGPPHWDATRRNWVSKIVQLPYIDDDPIILVPKFIVRRRLSLDSQEFYNKQITDFLISEELKANSSLVQTLKSQERVVYKKDIKKEFPKSKSLIADIVSKHPELLKMLKSVAKNQKSLVSFSEDEESIQSLCLKLASLLPEIPQGRNTADDYHKFIMGAFTALFYPDLIAPKKEWEINGGRKRIDIVYTNSSNSGFFSQRRDDPNVNANLVIVECKNYSTDIVNPELDQLIGRFNPDRGKLGIVTCRQIDDKKLLLERCKDAVKNRQGYIIVLSDYDIIRMLNLKGHLEENSIETSLHEKYRDIIS
ncbi:hypothetical protein [Gluconobacter cerinus]|uniref:hypothetical protein n=1 Tax=Gluconobacter cerinus TaxID=38307 RepID=UPI001B8CD746|nr:hypothetical protein [Gluconobacter cerinus]MBS0994722.1 hypothetical protein [Gluconobacter cerinus]